MSRRLRIYLAATFALSWGAWGGLALLAQAGTLAYGQWPFMALFILGGFGPTIGAYVAVLSSRAQAPLAEYHRRLLRWRLAPWWYLLVLGLPIGLAMSAVGIAALCAPGLPGALTLKPWDQFLALFPMMIVGGGLEELGWRGVAQPEMGRAIGPAKAALAVGLVWALWHLPLFFIPGVSQYGGNFPRFAAGVVGNALLLGWLYSRTESIFLCILFHAAGNAIVALGMAIPAAYGTLRLLAPGLSLALGAVLLLADSAGLRRSAAAGSPSTRSTR